LEETVFSVNCFTAFISEAVAEWFSQAGIGMSGAEEEKSWEQVTIRIERELKDEFARAVLENRDKMTPVFRDFMTEYIRKHKARPGPESNPAPLDSLDTDDLDRDQKELLRPAFVAVRKPNLNFGTQSLWQLLTLSAKRIEDFLKPSPNV
jgi:hypothetical protein